MLKLEFSSMLRPHVFFLALIMFSDHPLSAGESVDYDLRGHQKHVVGSIEPRTAAEIYKQAFTYLQSAQFEQAICLFTGALEIDSRFAAAYLYRGFAYRMTTHYDKAISDYTKAIELDSNYADAYFYRGTALNDKGAHDQAIADYTKVSELRSGDPWSYIMRGRVHYEKGQYDQAISDFTRALTMKPVATFSYYARGLAHWRKGHYDEAISDLNVGNPNIVAETHYYRGLVYLEKGEYDQAISDLDRTLQLNPLNTAANLYKAHAYERRGHIKEAIEAYRAFLRDLPASMRTLIEYATGSTEPTYNLPRYRGFLKNFASMPLLVEYATKRLIELEK